MSPPILHFAEGPSGEICTICRERYDEEEIRIDKKRKLVRVRPLKIDCNHLFHKRCLLEWVWRQPAAIPSCPICRSAITIPRNLQPQGRLRIQKCGDQPVIRVEFKLDDSQIYPFGKTHGSFGTFSPDDTWNYILLYPFVRDVRYILDAVIHAFKKNSLVALENGTRTVLKFKLPQRKICSYRCRCINHKYTHLKSNPRYFIQQTLKTLKYIGVLSEDLDTKRRLFTQVDAWEFYTRSRDFGNIH